MTPYLIRLTCFLLILLPWIIFQDAFLCCMGMLLTRFLSCRRCLANGRDDTRWRRRHKNGTVFDGRDTFNDNWSMDIMFRMRLNCDNWAIIFWTCFECDNWSMFIEMLWRDFGKVVLDQYMISFCWPQILWKALMFVSGERKKMLNLFIRKCLFFLISAIAYSRFLKVPTLEPCTFWAHKLIVTITGDWTPVCKQVKLKILWINLN